MEILIEENWDQKYYYSREEAVYPLGFKWAKRKHWPAVSRINDAKGDRNLITTWNMLEDK
jgi:glycine dehydrogenase